MAKNQAKQKEIVSPIHHDQIMTETIKKELKTMKLMTSFGYNAVKPSSVITGKPNSWEEANYMTSDGDANFKVLFSLQQDVPTRKYIEPQTSNQEYGWITQPLLPLDRADRRLYHPIEMSNVTKAKELEWAHQTKLASGAAEAGKTGKREVSSSRAK